MEIVISEEKNLLTCEMLGPGDFDFKSENVAKVQKWSLPPQFLNFATFLLKKLTHKILQA